MILGAAYALPDIFGLLPSASRPARYLPYVRLTSFLGNVFPQIIWGERTTQTKGSTISESTVFFKLNVWLE